MSEIRKILDALSEGGVRYVHFKSNPHLDANFTGDSDFDILVDRRDHAAFRRALMDCGAKQFEPTRYGVYPGVENWLALESDSGVLHHFHVHSCLASGLELYKDYILPWGPLILERRVYDEARGCYICDPNIEVLLLLTRMVIKPSLKGAMRARMGVLPVPQGMLDEFSALLPQLDEERLREAGARMFRGDAARAALLRIVEAGRLDVQSYRALCPLIRRELRYARRAGAARAHWISARLMRLRRGDRRAVRSGGYPIRKKVSATGGRIIAFCGIDGSGKSTAARQIHKWLGKKVEVRHAYLGSGREGDTRGMRALRALGAKIGRIRALAPLGVLLRSALYARSAARVRRELTMLNRYRLNGGIAITDRFPQAQMRGYNDGPKLGDRLNSRSALLRRLARAECARYGVVNHIQPDLVIRMHITAETSMKRHPEQENIETYRKKIGAMGEIRFDASTVVDVDAEQPLEQVLSELKKAVWEHI